MMDSSCRVYAVALVACFFMVQASCFRLTQITEEHKGPLRLADQDAVKIVEVIKGDEVVLEKDGSRARMRRLRWWSRSTETQINATLRCSDLTHQRAIRREDHQEGGGTGAVLNAVQASQTVGQRRTATDLLARGIAQGEPIGTCDPRAVRREIRQRVGDGAIAETVQVLEQ